MNEQTDTNPPAAALVSDDRDDQSTGFPALRSWRAVYLAVILIFILWVVLLTALSRAFR